jgi:hypothetical protein
VNHLSVGVGHGLYAVPAVVFVLHLEGVGFGFIRERKSTNIFGKFAEFAVFERLPARGARRNLRVSRVSAQILVLIGYGYYHLFAVFSV